MILTQNKITVEEYGLFCERMHDYGLFEYVNGLIYPVHDTQAVDESLVNYVISAEFNAQEIQNLAFLTPTQQHDDIVSNLHGFLGYNLKNKNYRVYSQATSVLVPELVQIRNPDLVIVKSDDQQRNKMHQITNPIVLIEVLSKSTQNIDKSEKLEEYQHFPSLEYYLMIAQNEAKATIYRKIKTNKWEQEIFSDLAATIDLKKISIQLPIAAIYEGINFEKIITN
jgi:Uma2 family endonuclease